MAVGTSPGCENLRGTSSRSAECGNCFQAYSTGAVASPSFRSAPPDGLPNASEVDLKSSRSSTSWNARPAFRPNW